MRVVEHDHALAAGGGLALRAADLDEPHVVASQLGKDDLLDVAQCLLELIASVRGDHDEVREVEVTAGGVGEPAKKDGSRVDTHAIAHHHRWAAGGFG